VVIPCRNEEDHIEGCINSIGSSVLENVLLTVIVVDGMSDDRTRDIVKSMTGSMDNLMLLDNPAQTTPFALNIGIEAHPFDVLIILGAHATVHKDFVQISVNGLRNDLSAGCCGGIIENSYHSEEAECIGLAMSHPFGVGNAHFRTGATSGYVDTVAFGAYRKEVFDSVGLFDEELVRNQDDEFNFRVTESGYRIVLDPAIRSFYVVRADLTKLFKQYQQYGYWKVYVNVKHGRITTWRQVVPALWVSYLLVGLLSTFLFPALSPIFVGGVVVYLVTALVIAMRIGKSFRKTFGVFRAFLVLHFSYGWGYMKGIVDHLILNRSPVAKSKELTR
jgi:cellulose synthase/poly-beta-1,6-N-acetylglucosamine synthase-like glycosyltransferase